jgi:hypothetical protein
MPSSASNARHGTNVATTWAHIRPMLSHGTIVGSTASSRAGKRHGVAETRGSGCWPGSPVRESKRQECFVRFSTVFNRRVPTIRTKWATSLVRSREGGVARPRSMPVPTDDVNRRSIMIAQGSRITVWAVLAVLSLTPGCSSAPRPGTDSRPEEDWVAATCLPASPDTTGWKVHRFADLALAVPAEFTVRNRTTRSIEFVNRGSLLALQVSTSATRDLFHAAGRPALAKEEAACVSNLGGYRGVIEARARANRFSVSAEWDGGPLWGPGDWRKRLIAQMTTGSLRDAQRLRDALHTLSAVRDTGFSR